MGLRAASLCPVGDGIGSGPGNNPSRPPGAGLPQQIDSIAIHPGRKPKGPILSYPDPSRLDEAVSWLKEAKNPLILASRVGKNPESVQSLVSFAEAAAAPVFTPNSSFMNFPTVHPHYLGLNVRDFLKDADLIVIADSDVPWFPNTDQPPA